LDLDLDLTFDLDLDLDDLDFIFGTIELSTNVAITLKKNKPKTKN